MTLEITEKSGVCRWCGCTERDPCPEGCGWVNREQTLCTSCREFDRQIRTPIGRRRLMEKSRSLEA